MKVTYVGRYDEVEVPAAGVVAKRGEEVSVPDDVGQSLLEQKDNWKAAGAKVPEKAKKGTE